MRKCLYGSLLLLLLVPPLLTVVPPSNAEPGGRVLVNLRIVFRGANEGSLEFYLGSAEPLNLTGTDRPLVEVVAYRDQNIRRLINASLNGGRDNSSFFLSLLSGKGGLELTNTNFSFRDEEDYFCYSFRTDFRFLDEGRFKEYAYLRLLRWYEDRFAQSSGSSIITGTIGREREMAKVRVDVRMEALDGTSMTFSFKTLGHLRSSNGEVLDHTTDAMRFVKGSNRITVFDIGILSPISVLIMTVMFLVAGYSTIAIVLWRKRPRGLGLVLPAFTALLSVLLPILFRFPGLSVYSIGGGTVPIYGGIFLLFAAGCSFVPKGRVIDDYESEKERSRFKMPEVIYVDRKVFVERKVGGEEPVQDPYKVLDLKRGASFEEIERAYRSLAKQYHPDRHTKGPERIRSFAQHEMERLNKAYEALRLEHGR